jgi:hypothetical protein
LHIPRLDKSQPFKPFRGKFIGLKIRHPVDVIFQSSYKLFVEALFASVDKPILDSGVGVQLKNRLLHAEFVLVIVVEGHKTHKLFFPACF